MIWKSNLNETAETFRFFSRQLRYLLKLSAIPNTLAAEFKWTFVLDTAIKKSAIWLQLRRACQWANLCLCQIRFKPSTQVRCIILIQGNNCLRVL